VKHLEEEHDSMKKPALLLGLAALLAAGTASAAPASTSFAGRLSTSAGPVNGAVSVTFTVYDAATGGSSQWNDTLSLTADGGLVYATLGSAANPLDETVFDGRPMFLEIRVGAETLSPRLPITSTPYAVRASGADSADLLGTLSPTDVQLRVGGTCAAGSSIRAIAADGSVTCQTDNTGGTGTITGVTAGTGLSGGGTTGNVTLSVNTTAIQARVTGTCAAGSSIRAIGADGTVTCQTDNVGSSLDDVIGNEVTNATNTTLTRSGSGTAASPYTLAVNTSVIQNRVTGSCTTGNAIRVINADGTVTCQAAGGGASIGLTQILFSGATSAVPTTTPTLFKTLGTFTKVSGTSRLVTTWSAHVNGTNTVGSQYCQYQLRLNGNAPAGVSTTGYGAINYGDHSPASDTNLWTGLAAGSYTATIYLRGSAPNCSMNSGGFSALPLVIQEIP
jgi:hypothetical protein